MKPVEDIKKELEKKKCDRLNIASDVHKPF